MRSDRVLFLDIDGVLLSGRAWLLPTNQRLQAMIRAMSGRAATMRLVAEAVFDPVAVELVNRVADATGARIVVSSSWRYTVGPEATRGKLLEQGLLEKLMHPDWACAPTGPGSNDKPRDIARWLEDHPEVADHLAIDDEPGLVPGRTLPVDPLDGLGPREAAAAVRYFEAQDSGLGVGDLPVQDREMVVAAFGGDRVRAAMWLEGVQGKVPRRSRPSLALAGSGRRAVLAGLGPAAGLVGPRDGPGSGEMPFPPTAHPWCP
ncbi:hypothetical protein APZ41_005345 [Roseomonas mucosa]|uniref:Uncharacterized protein n=1 Tax=Roseomonas mucosa TaxID=207340 RepID=A0A1S8D9R1_9PROT|nr:HAD domain-containing protein [Roseomonas mucosa]ONH84238.1 hypothetical protein APZ41_005345 [Roseomonas mucosa]